jgi:hypothetical protein
MSIAALYRPNAASLADRGRARARRLYWSRPLQALAEARRLKAEFEIAHVHRSRRERSLGDSSLSNRTT